MFLGGILAVIKMDNVTMQYPNGTVALDNINLKIEHGEFVFVVGESGSGKTTFVELVLRELKPTKGRIEVVGYDYANVSDKYIHKIRRMIGTVFQDFRLLPDMTVYENVAFAQKVIETPSRIIANQVPQVLSLVGLADKYRSFPAQLSGGEQQKVALARAIVNKPDIILADEPTGNLDPKNSWDIMKLLEEINARGTTVVVVTHNKEIVNTMKKRVVVLKEGKILSDEQEGEYRDED